jgi:hypothetical protein
MIKQLKEVTIIIPDLLNKKIGNLITSTNHMTIALIHKLNKQLVLGPYGIKKRRALPLIQPIPLNIQPQKITNQRNVLVQDGLVEELVAVYYFDEGERLVEGLAVLVDGFELLGHQRVGDALADLVLQDAGELLLRGRWVVGL